MAQVEQIRDLPEEVWKEILLKLWLNEEDLEHLLTCRLVCRLWKKVVDKMPPKLQWNSWLKHRPDDHGRVGYSIATIINSDLSIRKFLSGGFESEKNPFRNYTLSVFVKDIKKEEGNLLKMMEDHGQHVRKFFYHPTEEDRKRLTNLPQLLALMKNIRTLVMDCGYVSTKQLMAIDEKNYSKDLNHLNELVLSEECRLGYDSNDDDKICSKLSVNYGSQIKSLTLDIWGLHLNRSKIMERFPNLEDLKIKCSYIESDVVVPPAAKQWPKLKRLALATRCFIWDSISEKKMLILRVAGCFSETLQLPSLQIESSFGTRKTDYKSNQNNYVDVITTFPKLAQLIIPFWIMCQGQGQPLNIPLETKLRFSLPNLKSLVFEDTKDEFKDRDIGEAELEEICAPFWPLVPPEVETISVRIEKQPNQALHQDFRVPVVYTCKRNEVS